MLQMASLAKWGMCSHQNSLEIMLVEESVSHQCLKAWLILITKGIPRWFETHRVSDMYK